MCLGPRVWRYNLMAELPCDRWLVEVVGQGHVLGCDPLVSSQDLSMQAGAAWLSENGLTMPHFLYIIFS